MSYPQQFRYTREHEWIDVQEGVGTIGITDHAQSTLGDIVFVETPKLGARVEKGKVFGSVESVKAVSDLYSPASGEVSSVNDELGASPEKVNADAHGTWIMRIHLSNPSEVESLLTAADYEKFVSEETGH
jgi:glycine cleavage system H protein